MKQRSEHRIARNRLFILVAAAAVGLVFAGLTFGAPYEVVCGTDELNHVDQWYCDGRRDVDCQRGYVERLGSDQLPVPVAFLRRVGRELQEHRRADQEGIHPSKQRCRQHRRSQRDRGKQERLEQPAE